MKIARRRQINRATAMVMVLCFSFFTFRMDVLANSVIQTEAPRVDAVVEQSSTREAPRAPEFVPIAMEEWANNQNRALKYGKIKSQVDNVGNLIKGIATIAMTGADGTTVATLVLDLASQVVSKIGEGLAKAKNAEMMAAGIIVSSIGTVLDVVSSMIKIFTYKPQPITEVEKFRQSFIKAVKEKDFSDLESKQQGYLDIIGKLANEYDTMKSKVDSETKKIRDIIISQKADPNWQKKITEKANSLKQLVNDFASKVKNGASNKSDNDEQGDGNTSAAWEQVVNLSLIMANKNKGQSTLRTYAKVLGEQLTTRDGNVSLEQAYQNLQDYFSSLCGSQLQAINFHAEYLNSDKYRPHGKTPTQAQRKEALDDKFKSFQNLLKDQAACFKIAVQELASVAQSKNNPNDTNLKMYYAEDAKNINSLAWCFLASLFAPLGKQAPYQINVVFVSPKGGPKGQDGKSWETAKAGLQRALDDVKDNEYTELWLQAGTYYASSADEHPYSAGERDDDALKSFQMKNGCAIFGGFKGGEISCEQRDIVKNRTILDGQSKVYHVFMNHHPANNGAGDNNSLKLGSSATLNGVTINNGGFPREGLSNPHENGGGMFNGFGAAPSIANCLFEKNFSRDCGGAVANFNASPYFTNCVFANNQAQMGGNPNRTASGGAIAQLKLKDTPRGTAVFEKCLFKSNQALHHGGAIYLDARMGVTLNNCAFYSNSAGNYGGAIFTEGWSCRLEVNNSYFESNSTTKNNGGAIHVTNGAIANLANCTFYKNFAGRDGGALSLECTDKTAPCVVANCTFLQNYTDWANWGSSVRLWANGNLKFMNNIVKGPDTPRSGEIPLWLSGKDIDAHNNVYDIGYNIPSNNTKSKDFKINKPQYNGGWWPTCDIENQSPARNSAKVSVDADVNEIIAYDARGRKREIPFDCGAFEYQSKFTFHVIPPPKKNALAASKANMSKQQDGSSWDKACSLEQALLISAPGDEIWAKQGRYYPQFSAAPAVDGKLQTSIINSAGNQSFVLKSKVELYGGFTGEETDKDKRMEDASLTVLDGNIDLTEYAKDKPLKDTSKFKLPDGTEVEVHANAGHVVIMNSLSVIDGISVVNGEANRASHVSDQGGGILLIGQDASVRNCQINYNTANDFAAVYTNSDKSNTISRCLIAQNTSAEDASVLYIAKIDNSTISDNHGSGICFFQLGVVEYCTIVNNTGYGFVNSTAMCNYSILKNTKAAKSDSSNMVFTGCYGDTPGQTEPKLGALAQNGGWTATIALLPGSPCLDQGPENPGTPDQRGVKRDIGKADIGAFESRGELYVTVKTSDPALGLVIENGGVPAESFSKAILDGQFMTTELNFTAAPKDGRELVGWRYLNKVDDPKNPGKKIDQAGITYSSESTLKFDKTLVFGGYAEKTAVLQAIFSVPHYKVNCTVVVPGGVNANGEIFGDQPPTWRDINAATPEERVTGPIPKSTQDSPDKKTVVFNMFNESDLTLNFKGLGSAKLRYLTIDGVSVQTEKDTFVFNKVAKNYEVKAWFSESAEKLSSVQLKSSKEGGTVTPSETTTAQERGTVTPSGITIVKKGDALNIEAKPQSGYKFTRWETSGDATITNPTSPATTVHILNDTVVFAIFDKVPPGEKCLTVRNGFGSGSYAPGEKVQVQGYNSSPKGLIFLGWGSITKKADGSRDELKLDWNENDIVTTFTMPDQDVEVEALWGESQSGQMTLNVIDGDGSGNYNTGAAVVVNAYDRGKYLAFREWRLYDPLDEIELSINDLTATPDQATATIAVPNTSVTIEAIYEVKSDLEVDKLKITINDAKDNDDSVKIINAELPDDFELTEDVKNNLNIQIDDYELLIGDLAGEWKTMKNGEVIIFQTDKDEQPKTRIVFDMIKHLWSLDVSHFNSYGQIGNGRGQVNLIGSDDAGALFASSVTGVEETSSWSYSLKRFDDALIADQYNGEFGFVNDRSIITGHFKGVGGVGTMRIKMNGLALGLPDDVDSFEIMEISLNDFNVFIYLEAMGKNKYQAVFVGDPEGWVKMNVDKDELSLSFDTNQAELINIDDGLDIAISIDDYRGECHIQPNIKRVLRKYPPSISSTRQGSCVFGRRIEYPESKKFTQFL